MGITTALSLQIDLVTESRWNPFLATFDEDPTLAADIERAYVDAFQTLPKSIEAYEEWEIKMSMRWQNSGQVEVRKKEVMIDILRTRIFGVSRC